MLYLKNEKRDRTGDIKYDLFLLIPEQFDCTSSKFKIQYLLHKNLFPQCF